MNSEELFNNYQYHAPDEAKAKQHEALRQSGWQTAVFFNNTLPDCREKSLALTKLEEAVMWANAALARNG